MRPRWQLGKIHKRKVSIVLVRIFKALSVWAGWYVILLRLKWTRPCCGLSSDQLRLCTQTSAAFSAAWRGQPTGQTSQSTDSDSSVTSPHRNISFTSAITWRARFEHALCRRRSWWAEILQGASLCVVTSQIYLQPYTVTMRTTPQMVPLSEDHAKHNFRLV